MSETAKKPEKKRRWTITYVIARFLAYIVFHTICPLRIHHVERLNRAAPFIVIGNHNSWLDPIAMCYRIHGQQLRFLGKKELVKTKLGRVILDDLGTEFVTPYFITTFYSLLNNRLGAGLPTIVTTNITDGSLLEKRYTEKISSRLSAFVPFNFVGEDIRAQKASE